MMKPSDHLTALLWCEVNNMDYNLASCDDGNINILFKGKVIMTNVPISCLYCQPVETK